MNARNFLVSYSGRVGSTALIDTLKLLPNIVVPVFEELDHFAVEARGEFDLCNESNIHHHVGGIYADRMDARLNEGVSTGFKWRVWGDMREVAQVLIQNDVLLLNMMRTDIVEFIASLYISDVVYGEYNTPQFALKDATSEEERLNILFRYRMQPVDVDVDRYLQLYEERQAEEVGRFALLRQLQEYGVEIRTILYEDFAYKRFHFLRQLLPAIGQALPETVPVTKLSKVSLPFPSELFRNRAELMASARLKQMLAEWEGLVCDAGFVPLS